MLLDHVDDHREEPVEHRYHLSRRVGGGQRGETMGLINARELKLMKNTAVLINVSRGGIVDEIALFDALQEGTIWAAGLDVFETEPVPLDNPLLTLPNVTVLPHIGSASIKTRLAMMNLNAQAITAVLEGRDPENRIV